MRLVCLTFIQWQGTITPIDFVKKILFPYSERLLDDFISDEIVTEIVDYLQVDGACPQEYKPDFVVEKTRESCLQVLRFE